MLLHPYRYGVYDIREIDLENTLMDLIKNQSNPTIALLIKKAISRFVSPLKADTLAAAQALLNPWGYYYSRTIRLSGRP